MRRILHLSEKFNPFTHLLSEIAEGKLRCAKKKSTSAFCQF